MARTPPDTGGSSDPSRRASSTANTIGCGCRSTAGRRAAGPPARPGRNPPRTLVVSTARRPRVRKGRRRGRPRRYQQSRRGKAFNVRHGGAPGGCVFAAGRGPMRARTQISSVRSRLLRLCVSDLPPMTGTNTTRPTTPTSKAWSSPAATASSIARCPRSGRPTADFQGR